jgi:hypothetical protein
MSTTPLYTTKPPVSSGLTSMEAAKILHFLTDHFQVRRPIMKWSRTSKRGRYSVLKQTVIVGPRVWRGVHTVVHEFAHHLDLVRRGQAGTTMSMPRRQVTVRSSIWGTYTTSKSARREFHGESFTLALEDCVMAVFGDQNLYAWEAEYKSVMSNHAKRFRHNAGAARTPAPIGSSGWLVWRQGGLRPVQQPMAAEQSARPEPTLTVTPAARVVIDRVAATLPTAKQPITNVTRAKLKAVGNAAWAAPSAANNWQGGCLWARREQLRRG